MNPRITLNIIGLNVYNVVIMSVSVVVISNILSSRPTLVYAMEAAFILLSTTVTLCLLFLPKIYAIVTSGGNPVIASLGIVVDNTNTRRFVFDDTKEIYYRAEVQNRVYKRELVELDQQISRLERLLEIPPHPYPMLTEELLYLLPESSVDCTPQSQRRFKSELESQRRFKTESQRRFKSELESQRRFKSKLERGNSISDAGEAIGLDENDDVLMEMTFGPMNPTPLPQKRHSSVEPPKVWNSPLERLTRSLSIGGSNSRGRKRKKARAQNKSSLPFSSSDSHFINNGCHTDVEGTHHLRQEKPPRFSYDMSYLHSKHSSDFCNFFLDVNKRSLISRHDKITQTGNESAKNAGHVLTGQGAHIQETSCVDDPRQDWRETGSNIFTHDNEQCFSRGSSTFLLPGSFHCGQEKMFPAQNIRIELLHDDNKCSGNDDLQQTKGQTDSHLHMDVIDMMLGVKPYSLTNYSSSPVLSEAAQVEGHASSWYVKNKSLVVPNTFDSMESLNSSVYRPPGCKLMLNVDSSGRPRSASTPNPLTSPMSQSSESPSHSEMSPSSQTTNISNALLQPMCLSHHACSQILPRTPPDHRPHCCISNKPGHCESPLSIDTRFLSYSETLPSQDASSCSLQRIPLISLPQTKSSKTSHATGNSQPPSPTQCHCTVSSSSPPQPGFLSILDNSLTALQIFYSDKEHQDISLAQSPSANPTASSLPASRLQTASRQQPSDSAGDSNHLHVRKIQTSLQAERRKKIQKLQYDLVRIQKELQDLKDLEYDISEV